MFYTENQKEKKIVENYHEKKKEKYGLSPLNTLAAVIPITITLCNTKQIL